MKDTTTSVAAAVSLGAELMEAKGSHPASTILLCALIRETLKLLPEDYLANA